MSLAWWTAVQHARAVLLSPHTSLKPIHSVSAQLQGDFADMDVNILTLNAMEITGEDKIVVFILYSKDPWSRKRCKCIFWHLILDVKLG